MTDVEDIQALGKVLVNHHRDFLLELVVQALQQVMESEVTALTGAAKGARSEDRLTHRNGYRPRSLETRLGTADLAIPKLRKGSYLPSFIEPRRRWEKAFVNVVSEAYVLGVPTRKVELLQTKWPAAAELLGNAEEDVLAYMRFPDQHWRQIKSTNPLERLNREIRRRTDVVGIFPNDASILRLVTMLLVEQNDEWAVGRRYFSLASMALVTGAADVPPRALEAG